MNRPPVKMGVANFDAEGKLQSNAIAVPHSELQKHDNWSAGFHHALNTASGDPEQRRVFQRLMDEMGVTRIEVERALMQARDTNGAVKNVMRLILKRSRHRKSADITSAVSLEQLQNIEGLVRGLVGEQTGREQAQADRSGKRVAHLQKLSAESMVRDILAV